MKILHDLDESVKKALPPGAKLFLLIYMFHGFFASHFNILALIDQIE